MIGTLCSHCQFHKDKYIQVVLIGLDQSFGHYHSVGLRLGHNLIKLRGMLCSQTSAPGNNRCGSGYLLQSTTDRQSKLYVEVALCLETSFDLPSVLKWSERSTGVYTYSCHGCGRGGGGIFF